nr:aldo/keto reductase [uncultured Schaedlerella sp.]
MNHVSDNLTLHNGVKIPGLGFGVWQISPLHTAKCVRTAIKAGYRNIDTAEGYMNEKGVGEGVRQAMEEYGRKREEIFVSTKLWNSHRGYDKAMKAFEVSLKKLGLEYLDLYLIHWPAVSRWHDDWREINWSTWKAFEELYRDGRIKAIGVSNFLAHHVQALTEDSDIKPMVNQIEYHVGFGQIKSTEYCQANGIVVEAWSPLGSGGVLRNGELNQIAGKYGKSAAQICIRWLLQKNIVPLPKSTHEKYIMENADVFDFSISEEDMTAIDRIPYCGGMMFDPDSARS